MNNTVDVNREVTKDTPVDDTIYNMSGKFLVQNIFVVKLFRDIKQNPGLTFLRLTFLGSNYCGAKPFGG